MRYGQLERVRALFRRLVAMGNDHQLGVRDGIRLTPSHTEAPPLGARAIPHYFGSTTAINADWQPRLSCTTAPLWSYHDNTGFANDYNACSLIRIEGHLGDRWEDVVSGIEGLRTERNVEFRLLCSFLHDPSPDEKAAADALGTKHLEWARLTETVRAFIMQVANGKAGQNRNEFEDFQRQIVEVDANLRNPREVWIRTRARKLHCDVTHLQADYLEARSQLLCILHAMRGAIAVIEDLALAVKTLPSVSAVATFLIEDLRLKVELLTTLWLPKDIAGLHIGIFLNRDDDIRRNVLLLIALSSALAEQETRSALGVRSRQIDGLFTALWRTLRHCEHQRIAAAAAAYEQVRTDDPSYFPNLVKMVDGLEHIGGVEQGGTFVLVCDRDADDGTVVADFALACCLPCCCPVQPDNICLPPVAMADYRVVVLTDDRTVEIEIPVMENDYDPNRHDLEHRAKTRIEPARTETEFGATIETNDAQPNVIRYSLAEVRPGLDQFSYILRADGACPDHTLGHVVVVIVPTEADEPIDTGRISGTVTVGEGVSVPDTTVTLSTGAQTKTDEKSRYEFPDLPSGDYTVAAFRLPFLRASRDIHLAADQQLIVDLVLKRAGIDGAARVDRPRCAPEKAGGRRPGGRRADPPP